MCDITETILHLDLALQDRQEHIARMLLTTNNIGLWTLKGQEFS